MSTITNLFPTPVLISELGRDFTKKEINFVKNTFNKCRTNRGNKISIDHSILNNKELKNIKKFINDQCSYYLENIICPANKDIELYVTISWLNYTSINGYHHTHAHQNSVVSGVFYFDVDETEDSISFVKNQYNQIEVVPSNFNPWNSRTWWLPAKNGRLLMFPSSLNHGVPTKKENKKRVSLSFNTFIKGELGDVDSSTYLNINKSSIYK